MNEFNYRQIKCARLRECIDSNSAEIIQAQRLLCIARKGLVSYRRRVDFARIIRFCIRDIAQLKIRHNFLTETYGMNQMLLAEISSSSAADAA